MAEWTSARSHAERVENLIGDGTTGENDDVNLTADGPDATVVDDDAKDTMTGSQGLDWYFANLDSDVVDKITGLTTKSS